MFLKGNLRITESLTFSRHLTRHKQLNFYKNLCFKIMDSTYMKYSTFDTPEMHKINQGIQFPDKNICLNYEKFLNLMKIKL